MTEEQHDSTRERVRARSRAVEEAMCAILGLPAEDAADPRMVALPMRLPLTLATLMEVLQEQSSSEDIMVLYANVLMRGLWTMGADEDIPDLARAAAVLIHMHSTEEVWQSWSARYPLAREYVQEEAAKEAWGDEC